MDKVDFLKKTIVSIENKRLGADSMYNPYNEQVCRSCPFEGKTFEIRIGTNSITYIECKRDNADAQEHFQRTNSNESLNLWVKQTKFLHCLYANEKSYNEAD